MLQLLRNKLLFSHFSRFFCTCFGCETHFASRISISFDSVVVADNCWNPLIAIAWRHLQYSIVWRSCRRNYHLRCISTTWVQVEKVDVENACDDGLPHPIRNSERKERCSLVFYAIVILAKVECGIIGRSAINGETWYLVKFEVSREIVPSESEIEEQA